MAINYTNLFTGIGVVIKAVNQFRNMALGTGSPVPNLPSLYDDNSTGVAAKFASIDRYECLEGTAGKFDGFKNDAVSWCNSLATLADKLIMHKESVLDELPVLGPDPSLDEVLKELIRDMVANSRTVLKNTCIVDGTPTASASNNGNGVVVTVSYLDMVTPPSNGFSSHELYDDKGTELGESETMTFICTADSSQDGLPEGEEIFEVRGEQAGNTRFDWRNRGSGAKVSLPTLNSYHIVGNKDFELWLNNAPVGWTVTAGTAGTHIVQETDAAQVYRGDSCLKFVGNGVQDGMRIAQAIGPGQLKTSKMYCLSAWVKAESGIAAGTLKVQFESLSGGYDAGAVQTGGNYERIMVNSAALSSTTAWSHFRCFFITPKILPEDFELAVKIEGVLTNGKTVRVANLALGEVLYANGVGFAVVAGKNRFLRNDRFTVDISQNDAGLFQTFFRRRYQVQLPSVASSPTIAESLAQ